MGGWGSGVFNPLVYCWLCVLNLMVFYLGCKVSCCWGISWATPVPYSAPSLGFIFSVSTAHLPLPISTLEEAYELSPVQNWSPHLRPPRHSSCSTHYCGIFCHWHRTIILSIADPRISWGGWSSYVVLGNLRLQQWMDGYKRRVGPHITTWWQNI